ncbi:MarR family winged helix-turn-helix transcriptional regulator [Enterococcus sp. LJL128]
MTFNKEDITEKIYTLSVLQQSYVGEHLRTLQLNSLQARSLTYVYKHPATIQRGLANYLGKKQATVTNILKILEEKQLIYREIPKENERQKNIFLTEQGKQMVIKIEEIFQHLNEELCSTFSEEEHHLFLEQLKKAEKALENV